MNGRLLGVVLATVMVGASACSRGPDGPALVEAADLPCPELVAHTDRHTVCSGPRGPVVMTVGSRSELIDAIYESGLDGNLFKPPLVVGANGRGAWAVFVVDRDDAEQAATALDGEILSSFEDFDRWARDNDE